MADPVALGIQVPDSFKTIGSMLDFSGKAQNLQRGNIDLQKNQIILNERLGIQKLFGDPRQFTNEDGSTNYNKLIPSIMEVAPTTGAEIVPKVIQGHKAAAEAQKELNALDSNKRNAVGTFMMSFKGRPYQELLQGVDQLTQVSPELKGTAHLFKGILTNAAQQGQEALDRAILQVGQMTMSAPEQRQAMTPSGVGVETGQQSATINTNPMAGAVGSVVPGTLVQKQLPPTTEVFNPATNSREYLGAQPQGQWLGQEPKGNFAGDPAQVRAEINAIKDPAARAGAMRALQNQMGGTPEPGRLQAAPALGAERGIEGSVATNNKDWDETVASANRAATDIGVMQNIKKYAPGAATGVLSERRAFIQGLADLLGIDAAKIGKTDTDLLIKNSNMAAIGGNTDAMRTLLESANPNVRMNDKAIIAAADQIIAQRKMMLAKQQFLQPFKTLNDPNVYSRALSVFNANADPRILQLPDMTTEEKSKMKAAMTETERREFGEKIRKLQELGIVK